MKFEPSKRERNMVFKWLPASKKALIGMIQKESGLDEQYARSLIWNMKRIGEIYTNENHLLGKVRRS